MDALQISMLNRAQVSIIACCSNVLLSIRYPCLQILLSGVKLATGILCDCCDRIVSHHITLTCSLFCIPNNESL